jgi:hypothetical protein|tara:strand:+ start:534 stop:638 length:105 start_codon:yes stop_codon:yes gene_type:complete
LDQLVVLTLEAVVVEQVQDLQDQDHQEVVELEAL